MSPLPDGRRVRYLLAEGMAVREATADEVLAVLRDENTAKRASTVSQAGVGPTAEAGAGEAANEDACMDEARTLIGQEEREEGVCVRGVAT
jgi:hypothetical protein